jgi:hypothetical protein
MIDEGGVRRKEGGRKALWAELLKRLDSYDPDGPRVDRETPNRKRESQLILLVEKARWRNRC